MAKNDELIRKFKRCLLYQTAAFWQKPCINPARFLTNQIRKHRLISHKPGEIRTVSTFHVPKFAVVSGEGVSEQIASYGIYEPNLTWAFLHLVKPGDVVVDIGMHLGYYTTLFAKLVGESGEVHGFEPTPSTRRTAEPNVSRFSQIIVHPEAVWSRQEKLTFYDYGRQWMAFNSFTVARLEQVEMRSEAFVVEAISLDKFRQTLVRPISLIKIDAESAEEEILSGAENLLKADQPLISMEVGDFQNQPSSRRLIERIQGLGYTAWEFENGKFQRHTIKDYYSYDNLIFAPESKKLSPA